MFHIDKNGIITLTRGDSCTFPLFLNMGTPLNPLPFNLQEGDKVRFKVMRANEKFEDAFISKTYTIADLDEDGNIVVKFEPSDTNWFEAGMYYYEVKLEYVRDEIDYINTFIPRTRFHIVN